jgi:surfactin synthase thioesterase subunit
LTRTAAGRRIGPAGWAVRPLHRPDARVTLICFHAAGSGAAMYRRWPALLPESVDPVLVRMPGRESRFGEPLIDDFTTAVAALAAGLDGCFDRPYALFGHSMGAHLAFALAVERDVAGLRLPEHMFVSGTRPPHLFRPPFGSEPHSDEQLVAALAEMGGTDSLILSDREARRIILAPFRADLRICAGLRIAGRPLPCALSVFGGADDDISRADLAEWSRWSTRSVTVTMFAGRHFFVNTESESAVLHRIAQTLVEPYGP